MATTVPQTTGMILEYTEEGRMEQEWTRGICQQTHIKKPRQMIKQNQDVGQGVLERVRDRVAYHVNNDGHA